MTTEELLVSSLVPASPNRIFAAWMDERQHSAFTGGRAHIDPWVGGRVSAWDGYIYGNHLFLDTGRRIVMAWRTTDFPEDAPDSQVDVGFEPVAGGTNVSIRHTGIPAGQSAKYREAWKTHYLEPMARFFAKPGAMKAAIRAAVKGGLLSQAALTPSRPSAPRGAHNVFASDAPPPFTGASPAPVSNAKLRLARLREERAARDAAAAAAVAEVTTQSAPEETVLAAAAAAMPARPKKANGAARAKNGAADAAAPAPVEAEASVRESASEASEATVVEPAPAAEASTSKKPAKSAAKTKSVANAKSAAKSSSAPKTKAPAKTSPKAAAKKPAKSTSSREKPAVKATKGASKPGAKAKKPAPAKPARAAKTTKAKPTKAKPAKSKKATKRKR